MSKLDIGTGLGLGAIVAGLGAGAYAFYVGFIGLEPRTSLPAAPWTISGFLGDIWPAISALPLSHEAQTIVAAHAAFESGWGRATPAKLANNVLNVTRGTGNPTAYWAGECLKSGDLECDAGGACVKITQDFRKYNDLASSVNDYFYTVLGTWVRYRASLAALESGDPEGFIRELGAAGYYTLSADKYVARWMPVFNEVMAKLM